MGGRGIGPAAPSVPRGPGSCHDPRGPVGAGPGPRRPRAGEVAMETFGAVLIAVLVLGGPLIAALALNLRDRRQARLLGTVLAELGGPDLRGRVAIKVRGGLLGVPSVVKIHLLCASRQEIWEILGRLSERLSRRGGLGGTGPRGGPPPAPVPLRPG